MCHPRICTVARCHCLHVWCVANAKTTTCVLQVRRLVTIWRIAVSVRYNICREPSYLLTYLHDVSMSSTYWPISSLQTILQSSRPAKFSGVYKVSGIPLLCQKYRLQPVLRKSLPVKPTVGCRCTTVANVCILCICSRYAERRQMTVGPTANFHGATRPTHYIRQPCYAAYDISVSQFTMCRACRANSVRHASSNFSMIG